MPSKNAPDTLAPIVLQVIDEFAAAMRADTDIEDGAVDRLEAVIRKGTIPRSEDIYAALFEPSDDQI